MPAQTHTYTIELQRKHLLWLLVPVGLIVGSYVSSVPQAKMQLFSAHFLSIFIEATPFLLLGTLASGAVEVFVPADFLLRVAPKGVLKQTIVGTFAGFLFPVCECGVIPLVRRFFSKGMPVAMGIAFLLAAPVMNPIVLASTFMAFGFGKILIARFVVTMIVAISIGLIVARNSPAQILARQKNDHSDHSHENISFVRKLQHLIAHATDDFFDMVGVLIVGCIIASALQVVVPQATILPLANGNISSVIIMQGMAFLMSLCSTVDAFVALGFASMFSAGSVVAFLTFGPMVDIKTLCLFTKVLRARAIMLLVLLPLLMTGIAGIILNLI